MGGKKKTELTFNQCISTLHHSSSWSGLSRFNLFAEDCSTALSLKSDIQPLLGRFDFSSPLIFFFFSIFFSPPSFLVWLHIKRHNVIWNAGFYF